jgi:DNA transposition AAA+ family ATPase
MSLRDEARSAVLAYQNRTGLNLRQLAGRLGYAYQTLKQFVSETKYGDGNGDATARMILTFIALHPPERPALPGRLYSTENVRILDEMIAQALGGAIVLAYGPPGTQKSFVFEYRMAEAWGKTLQPSLGYIYAAPQMGLHAFAVAAAKAIGTPASGIRQNIIDSAVSALCSRKQTTALIVDEAHHLGGRLDTLEVLRELVDRARLGVVLAGHDNLEEIFQSKKAGPLEQWFSRVDFHRRLPGLHENEIRSIAREELGQVPHVTLDKLVESCRVKDYREGKLYLSMRRLMKILGQLRAARRGQFEKIVTQAVSEEERLRAVS